NQIYCHRAIERVGDKEIGGQGDKEKNRKTSCLLVPPSPCLPLSSCLCGSVALWLCGQAFFTSSNGSTRRQPATKHRSHSSRAPSPKPPRPRKVRAARRSAAAGFQPPVRRNTHRD